MRYWIGFVLAVALAASPVTASADPPETGDLASREKFALLLIPDHLQQRVPGQRRTGNEINLEYETQETPEQKQKNRRLALGLGISLSVLAVTAAVSVGAMSSVLSWD